MAHLVMLSLSLTPAGEDEIKKSSTDPEDTQ